jgi:hypothetical protein
MRVIDVGHRALTAQALVEEEQVLGAEVVGGARIAREVRGIGGVQLVLPVLAAPHLVAADDEAAHLFGISLERVAVDLVEHLAGELTTHSAFPT